MLSPIASTSGSTAATVAVPELLQRIGAQVHPLEIAPRGAGIYRVDWGDQTTYIHCEGDEIAVMNAAGEAAVRRFG